MVETQKYYIIIGNKLLLYSTFLHNKKNTVDDPWLIMYIVQVLYVRT